MTQKGFPLTTGLIFLSLFSGLSQNLFQKSFNLAFTEQTVAIETLSNGHFVLAGFTTAANGRQDIWMVHVNASGDVVWSRTYALAQASQATALQKTADGNLLLAYNSTGSSINANSSGWMKIAGDGSVIWSKKAIGNSSLTKITKVAGGYVLCGQSFTASQATGLIVRIGEDGAIQWSSVFGENGSSAVSDCWEDALGFLHCCGYTSESGGKKNGFWAKLSPAGELVGPVRRYGSTDDDELTRILPMGSDRLLMTGYSKGFNNSAYTDVWAVVIDREGLLKSSKTFSLAETNLIASDMIALPGDQFVLTLRNRSGVLSPAIMMKLNSDLDQLFAWQYKGGSESDAFTQVIKTNTGFAAMGTTKKNGDENAYLVATDGLGKLNNEDCCPFHLDIKRQEVYPETWSFVPTQTAFYAVQNNTFAITDRSVAAKDLCQKIGLEFTLSQDTICPGECVEIILVDSTFGVNYSFEYQGGKEDPDQFSQVCHTEGPALFITRTGSNGGCSFSLTKRVTVGPKQDNVPNAFSPNEDASNDIFRPVFSCPAASMHLQIFNRFGKLVFETRDPQDGWDGTIGGNEAMSDLYVWILEYEVVNNGKLEKMSDRGQVTLLR